MLAGQQGLRAEREDSAYLWLETLESSDVVEWANTRTGRTLDRFASGALYDSILSEIRSGRAAHRLVFQNALPPLARFTGAYADRITSTVWTRQPVESFRSSSFEGVEYVLTLQSLSAADGADYSFDSVDCRPDDPNRCLVFLADAGRTRVLSMKEFDVEAGNFVADGFDLGGAQTTAAWSGPDASHVATAEMGWAEDVRLWRRGESLDDARVIFRASPDDRGLRVERRGDRTLLLHAHDQYDVEYHLLSGEDLVQLDVPRDVKELFFVEGQLVVHLRSGWSPGVEAFSPGSLIGIDLDAFLAGDRRWRAIMSSSRERVVDRVWAAESLVVVRTLSDVRVGMSEFAYGDSGWSRREIDVPALGNAFVEVHEGSDTYDVFHESFLRPRRAVRRQESGAFVPRAHQLPWFDASSYRVQQRFATSADGTRVPYFLVHDAAMEFDGTNPVLMRGYGGNGISELPSYLTYLDSWLRRGGVYVLTNIRGGGEYGPEWHYAVRRERRQGAFDDFQAVAEDLVEAGITSPGMTGAQGGSNGGILVAMSGIQRPDLFGAAISLNGVLELMRCSNLSGDPPVGERGDGQNPADWAYMRDYSPFHNLGEGQAGPAMLVLANRADDVVHPCHSRKFVAKREDLGISETFLYETGAGGHSGGGADAEMALQLTFLLSYLHPGYR